MRRTSRQAREALEHEIQREVYERARRGAFGKPGVSDDDLRKAIAQVAQEVLEEYAGSKALLPPPRITVLTCLQGDRVVIRANVEGWKPEPRRPARVVPIKRQ